jgi:UDP-N-acetyl-D-mannosaminuronic acid dehydrogenase
MKVNVIGLGYIGLPTSILIASKGINVRGVDIKSDIIKKIINLEVGDKEKSLKESLKLALDSGFLNISMDIEQANVHVIVVPTPIKENHFPDMTFVENAVDNLLPFLRRDDLIIIESTSPVGTTENVKQQIFQFDPILAENIFIAYCPERVLPGNLFFELKNNSRIVGGINELSNEKARKFYSMFVDGEIHVTDSRTAEMVKLVENTSRDLQIAFANELSIICDLEGINVLECISLANLHPRVSILQPGIGVGGHCLAVDPYFITSKHPSSSSLIQTGRKVNLLKTDWVLKKIIEKISNIDKNEVKLTVRVFGLSYKPNVDDLRESPAVFVYKELKERFLDSPVIFEVLEPNINFYDENFRNLDELSLNNNLLNIILVAHNEFKSLPFSKLNTLDFTHSIL